MTEPDCMTLLADTADRLMVMNSYPLKSEFRLSSQPNERFGHNLLIFR